MEEHWSRIKKTVFEDQVRYEIGEKTNKICNVGIIIESLYVDRSVRINLSYTRQYIARNKPSMDYGITSIVFYYPVCTYKYESASIEDK